MRPPSKGTFVIERGFGWAVLPAQEISQPEKEQPHHGSLAAEPCEFGRCGMGMPRTHMHEARAKIGEGKEVVRRFAGHRVKRKDAVCGQVADERLFPARPPIIGLAHASGIRLRGGDLRAGLWVRMHARNMCAGTEAGKWTPPGAARFYRGFLIPSAGAWHCARQGGAP